MITGGAADQVLRSLVKEVTGAQPAGQDLRLRQGVVTAIAADSATVILGSSAKELAGIKCLVMPTVGATIWALQNGPDILILGPQAV
jgi:hypothetical protein